jgi:hypothetical protein
MVSHLSVLGLEAAATLIVRGWYAKTYMAGSDYFIGRI